MQTANRNGLTLLDVIVTIVILTVLVALLLPAVNRGPTPAIESRWKCKANLKVIGIAFHYYHDTHSQFPPGWIVSETAGHSSGFSWSFQTLPYMDQVRLYDQFDPRLPLTDVVSGNAGLVRTVIPTYRCPSDRGPDQAASQWGAVMGTTNYVGNFGVGIPSSFSKDSEAGRSISDAQKIQGILGPDSSVQMPDITDGTSNTILAGERRLPVSGKDWPTGRVQGSFNSYWAGIPNPQEVSPLSVVATATGMHPELDGDDDVLNRTGNLNGLLQPSGIQSLPYFGINRGTGGDFLHADQSGDQVSAGFSSVHKGGCNILLCDGAVRFVSDQIDPIVFANLMRRADGQAPGDF